MFSFEWFDFLRKVNVNDLTFVFLYPVWLEFGITYDLEKKKIWSWDEFNQLAIRTGWDLIKRDSLFFFSLPRFFWCWLESSSHGVLRFNTLSLSYTFFFLNWFSLGVFKWFVNPALEWILPDPCAPVTSQDFCSYNGSYAFLRGGLLQLFYVSLLLPFRFSVVYRCINFFPLADLERTFLLHCRYFGSILCICSASS